MAKNIYHVAACFHTGPISSNNRRKKKKKKKKKRKKEKETDRGRDRLSRLEDTSSFSWKRHWQNGSLGRTASRGFRESSTWKESKIKRERERERERVREYIQVYIRVREKEREYNPSLSPYTFLSLSLSLSPTLLLLPPRSKLLFSSGYTTDSSLFLFLSLSPSLSHHSASLPRALFPWYFLTDTSVRPSFSKIFEFDSTGRW